MLVTSITERIQLAKQHNIDEWIYPSLCALALRKEPLSEDEVYEVGNEYFVMLSRVREEIMPERWRIMESLMNASEGVDQCCFCSMEFTSFWFKSLDGDAEKRLVAYEITRAFGDLPGGPSGDAGARTISSQPAATAPPNTTRAQASRSRASSVASNSSGCCCC